MAYIGNSPGVASQRVVTTFTATANQTVFTPTSGYTLGYIDVYLNGVKLAPADFTASNGTTVVLASGAALDDVVETIAYLPRGLSDGYTKAEADSRYLPIDATTLPSQTGNSGYYLTTDGSNASWAPLSVVRVSGVDYPGDDLAADPAGGQTVTINGSGFAATPTVYVGGTIAPSVTFVSSSQITFTTPAKTAGTYDVYVVNPDGSTAISVFGISYSGLPTWSTAAGSLGESGGNISIQLQATSNSAVTYSLSAGSTLPAGITLSSSGLISGSTEVEQTFNFSVDAIDAENQETPRSFSVTISVADPYFRYNTLLLSADGNNAAQNNTFLDSSTNNFTITRNGNTTQGTFSPFSQTGWSNYFDGSGDYLTTPVSANLALGGSDFCIEWWEFRTSTTGLKGVLGGNTSYSSVYDPIIAWVSGSSVDCYLSSTGSSWNILSGFSMGTVAANQWVHRALTRSGTTFRGFENGVLINTTTASGSVSMSANGWRIGQSQNQGANTFQGYLSNLRMVIGSAVYTSAFTPSTTPLTAISGTSLLTCQSNRFRDASTNNFAITVNGNTSVQAFSPFAPTAAYSAATVGGSGYFDGSGDYLDVSSSSSLTPSGDFTIEFWAYPTSASGIREWYSKGSGIQVYSTGAAWGVAFSANNSGTYYINVANFGTLIQNQWQHIVVTRSGNSYVGFVNGVAYSLGTSSSAPATGTDPLRLGDFSGSAGYPVIGYMSGVRFVNGTVVYGTSTFTPPTAPPTAVANTQLLLNFTNGGIIDNTAKNVLETVGNAQISTSVKKFGTGSLAFDGTGDWMKSPSTLDTAFGTGDFTVECWVYHTTNQSNNAIVGNRTTGVDTVWSLEFYGANNILNWHSGTSIILVADTATTLSAWNHVAVTRSGTTLRMFLNGTQVASATDTRNYISGPIQLGYEALAGTSGIGYLNGYIDDLRITKGVARYTANFTPQTSQWQDQ